MNFENARLQDLAAWVRRIRAAKGLSQLDVVRRGGPSSGWLGGLEAGTLESAPRLGTLRKLARGLGEPLEGVLRSAGLLDDYDAAMRAALAVPAGSTDARHQGALLRKFLDHPLAAELAEDALYEAGRWVKVALGGRIGDGRRINPRSKTLVEVPIEVAERGDYAVEVGDDSLNRLGVTRGDLLMVSPLEDLASNQLVIAHLPGGAVCRRYKRFGELGFLLAETFEVSHEPVPVTSDVEILGHVTYAYRLGISFDVEHEH